VQNTRTWYGGVEYLHSKFDAPDGAKVGSRPANIRRDTQDFPGFPPGTPNNNGNQQVPGGQIGENITPNVILVGPGAYPFVVMREQVDSPPYVGVIRTPPEVGLFPQRNLSVFNEPRSNGMRLRAGYFNGDGTGLGAEAWWGFDDNQRFQVGNDNINGIPITQNMIAGIDLDGTFPDEHDGTPNNPNGWLIPFAKVGGLPLVQNSGVMDFLFPDQGFTGSTQKYDLMYRLDYSAEAGGGNVNFYLGRLRQSTTGDIKPYVSARYLYINEAFAFTGLDSGFTYAVDFDSNDPPTFRPDGAVFGPFYDLFRSYLQSTVTSNLAGPELGLRGDVGRNGGTLKVWWSGSLGLMANHERVRVRGNNIGDAWLFHTNIGDPTNPTDDSGLGVIFGPAYDMFAADNSFSDVETHTHVSPLLNLGINAELDIFDTVPLLRRISLFDAAKLTVGYNLLMVGKLARPGNSVKWRGFPEFPSVNVRYDNWDTQQFSLGLTFEK
jgi:hypothetical protein